LRPQHVRDGISDFDSSKLPSAFCLGGVLALCVEVEAEVLEAEGTDCDRKEEHECDLVLATVLGAADF
jgi:hypothetical protein